MSEVFAATLELLARGERAAIATVVRTRGSTPQVAGARLLLRDDGTTVGTVGGGRIEEVVIEALREVLAGGGARLVRKHLGQDLGMCCGGEMEIFIEPVEARPELILFGAGHVAKPTAAFARAAGFAVTVVDAREEQNDEARFPDVARVLADPAEAVRAGALPFGPHAYVVICTHDHRLDEEALVACLDREHRYLGMIGSERKVLRIFQRIRHRNPRARLDQVYAPIGLDLGAFTPEEIALSIVAEMVSLRRGGNGKNMRIEDRPTPSTEAATDAEPE